MCIFFCAVRLCPSKTVTGPSSNMQTTDSFLFIACLFFSCRCGPTRTDERQKKTRIEVKKKCISTKEKEIFVSNETLRLAVFRKVVAEINAAKKKQKKNKQNKTKQKRNAGTGVEGAVPIRDVIDWLRPAPAATARRWVEPGKEGGGHSRAKKKGKKRKKKGKKSSRSAGGRPPGAQCCTRRPPEQVCAREGLPPWLLLRRHHNLLLLLLLLFLSSPCSFYSSFLILPC